MKTLALGFVVASSVIFVSSCSGLKFFSSAPSAGTPSVMKSTPQPTTTSTPVGKNPQVKPSISTFVHNTDPIAGVSESKLLCGVASGGKMFEVPDGRGVRVATVNLYGAFSTTLDSLKARIDLHAQNIINASADAVGLQEVEDMQPAGLSVEMLARKLSELSGETWYWCYFRSNPHAPLEGDSNPGGGGPLSLAMAAIDGNSKKLGQTSWFMGDAVVSRFPFASAGGRRISKRVASEYLFCQTEQCRQWALGESRVVMRTELMVKGQSLHFFNSHFYTNISSESEKTQIRQVSEIDAYMKDVTATKKAPLLLTCDCNSPSDGVVRAEMLKLAFSDSWSATNSATSGFTGGQNLDAKIKTATSRIDYIFLKDISPASSNQVPENPAKTPVAGTILWPSDHLGVVVEFKN